MHLQMFISVLLLTALPLYGTFITSANVLWPITVSLVALCLLRMGQSTANILKFFGIPVLVLINFVNTAFFISYYLQDEGFNSAFLFHFNPNIFFSDIFSYWWLIMFLTIESGLLVLFSIKTVRYYSPFSNKRKSAAYLVLLTVSLYWSPPVNEIINIIGSGNSMKLDKQTGPLYSKEFSDFLKREQISLTHNDNIKNFVFIYLESLEQAYFDNDLFPNLVPGLTKIKDNSVDFRNIISSPGMAWTTAGLVASQCGVPLKVPFNGLDAASIGIFENFMPKAKCLGDALSDNDYELTFMGGADLRFGGKGNFLRTHGFEQVLGRQELKENLSDGVSMSSWGIYDDTLFDLIFDRYLILANESRPFGLFMLTLDTHHPSGFPSPTCTKYAHIDNNILHSVHCTDQLSTNFVNKIRNSPYSKDTIIFFFSDHIAQRNTASSFLKKTGKKRKLTFFVNYPDGRKTVNSQKGTHLDIPATIIELLGLKGDGELFGFGRSLLARDGYFSGEFNNIKIGRSPLFTEYVRTLWEDEKVPSILAGASINLQDLSVSIGDNRYNIRRWGSLNQIAPTVFVFKSKDHRLSKLYCYSQAEEVPSDGLSGLMKMNPSDIYLAISPANFLEGLVNDQHENEIYVLFGHPGRFISFPSEVGDNVKITAGMVREIIESEKGLTATVHRPGKAEML